MATVKKSRTAKVPDRAQEQKPPVDAPPSEPANHPEHQAAPQDLALPKGAFLAMRRRHASTLREVVVYPDGRVTYSVHDKPDNRLPRKLTDAQIANLRRLLDQAGFFRMPSAAGQPAGEAQMYELGAHQGNRTHYVFSPADAMPALLVPLIERLTELLPSES